MLVSLMRGAEKVKIEEKKLKMGSGERKLKENGEGRGTIEQKNSLENAQKLTRVNRMRKAEKTFTETKIINGGKFSIVKCAEFGVERSSRKRKQGIRCGGGRVKMEDLEACGPGEAVVEMEQQRPGEDLKASGPGKAVVEMEQPCPGVDLEACGPGENPTEKVKHPEEITCRITQELPTPTEVTKLYVKRSGCKCKNTRCEKLDTLDFATWPEIDNKLNFVYFEKSMRTQFVIMKRSAISDHQRYQILSNELIRRLSNIDRDRNGIDEQNPER